MASLKTLTVKYLRDLARKHLGKGHSRLKTKEELLAALKSFVPGLGGEEAPESAPLSRKTMAAEVVTFQKRNVAARTPGDGSRNGKTSAPSTSESPRPAEASRPAEPAPGTPTSAAPRAPQPDAASERAAKKPSEGKPPLPRARAEESRTEASRRDKPQPPAGAVVPLSAGGRFAPQETVREEGFRTNGANGHEPHDAEPLIEGFFVARVQGEWEARQHHLTGAHPHEATGGPKYDEHLPELPAAYLDDRVVLCVRDPHTVWVYWDFHPNTRDAAFAKLQAPQRTQLRVVQIEGETRVFDCALESRSFYLHGLDAGRAYRVELIGLGADGATRRIGSSSNVVTLPRDTVSDDHSVRMMRVPWGVPLSKLREAVHRGAVTVETPATPPQRLSILHEHWIPAANSGSWQLQRWHEQIELAPTPLDVPPPPPMPAGGHVPMMPFPVGGSSSWTLQSSSSWLGGRSGRGGEGL